MFTQIVFAQFADAGERWPALLESVWPVNAGLAIGGRAGSLFNPQRPLPGWPDLIPYGGLPVKPVG